MQKRWEGIIMEKYFLAVDIGASSGRHILGSITNSKIVLEEVYRFENGMVKKDGHLCWDTERLFRNIKQGMKVCKEKNKIPESMAIDTWAVDYVLLDKNDKLVGNTYGYRDARTKNMDKEVYKLISKEDLYRRTGIQKLIFNTVYQLMALKKQEPEVMDAAESLLFIPDYFHFLLTGNKLCEYTNATTGQLVSPITKNWDYQLIKKLGYKKSMFQEIIQPGALAGRLTPQIAEEVGFCCDVILPATHDTGSAVMAVPALKDTCMYISSGTWSLMGIENNEAVCTRESMEKNFTNEGGYEYRFRYLKNIMGLWMIQSVRHELGDKYSFAELCEMAEEEKTFPSRVDVNDERFFAPDNMVESIRAYCRESGQKEPLTIGQIATVVYQSLAESYADTAKEIEALTGKKFNSIYIVGGGSNAVYLNQLTAEKTGKTIYAGPGEATAIGNLMAQMIQKGEFMGLQEARRCVHESFEIKEYQ